MKTDFFAAEELAQLCKEQKIPSSGKKSAKIEKVLENLNYPWETEAGELKKIAYTGREDEGPAQIVVECLGEEFNVHKVWQCWLPDDVLHNLFVENTNKKAAWLKAQPTPPKGYPHKKWPPKFLEKWKNVELSEMKIFLAILVAKNSLGKGVTVSDLWAQNSLIDYRKINNQMGRERWKALNSALSVYDPSAESDDNNTPYWKIHNLVETFRDIFRKNYQPSQFISRDEQCVKNHHRTKLRHLHMPKKYIQIGIRIEALTSIKGVVIDFMIDYPDTSHNLQTLEMIKSVQTKGHLFFMDRLYTSFFIVQEALKIDQYVAGTCRSDRGFPLEIQETVLKMNPGEWQWRYRKNVYAYSWVDSAHCQLLSSFHPPKHVERRVRGQSGRVQRAAPQAFADYNAGMGGCDLGDNLRSRYSSHQRSKKWWKAILYYIIDQTHIATYRTWNKLVPHKKMNLRKIIQQIFFGLTGSEPLITSCQDIVGKSPVTPTIQITGKKRTRSSISKIDPKRFQGTNHLPASTFENEESKKKKVYECAFCRSKGERSRTSTYCIGCDVSLCVDCFVPWHCPETWSECSSRK